MYIISHIPNAPRWLIFFFRNWLGVPLTGGAVNPHYFFFSFTSKSKRESEALFFMRERELFTIELEPAITFHWQIFVLVIMYNEITFNYIC